MKNIRKLFSILLAVFIAMQPLWIASAVEIESEPSIEVDITTVILEFQLDENTKNQKTIIDSNYEPILPKDITVITNVLDQNGKIDETKEGTTQEVEVIWNEKDSKTFLTSKAETYTYQALLVDETLQVQEGVELPTINIEVEEEEKNIEESTTLKDELEETITQIPEVKNTPTTQSEVEAIAINARGDIYFRSSDIPYAPVDDKSWSWDYVESKIPDTGSYSYALGVNFDPDLEPGAKRIIEVNIDPYNNGEYHALQIANAAFGSDYIDQDKSYYTSTKIYYVFDNDALNGAEAIMTFSLEISNKYNGGTTNYHIAEGTIASAIGYMLLNAPNADLGIKVQEYQQGTDVSALNEELVLEDSEVSLKHTIRRDNHGTQPIISEYSLVYESLSNNVTDKTITELWLGNDGHLYYNDPTTNLPIDSQSYGYAFRFTEEDHAPVGNFKWSLTMPEEIPIWYTTTSHIPYTLTINEENGSYSMIDIRNSLTMSNGYMSTGNVSATGYGEMLTGIKSTPTQMQFAFRSSGTGGYGIRGPLPLHQYTENGTYESEVITAEYDQVVPDTENGGYKIEHFTQEFGKMVIHVPEYVYEDRITMEASIPEKVNYDDPTGMEYNFSIFNNVLDADVNENIAPYFHNGGVMTMTFNDENFDPHTIKLDNEFGEFISYQVEYADGTFGPVRNVNGEFTVDAMPNLAGYDAINVRFNISEQGLVRDGYTVNYETGGFFTGEFTEPTGTNSIKVDVNFSSDGNGTNATPVSFDKEITWEYETGTDYLHLYQEFDNPTILVNDNKNYLTSHSNADLHLGAAIPEDAIESSVVYRNVDVNMFDTSLATDEEHAKQINAVLAQGGYSFTFDGTDKSIEYETLDEPDVKVWIEYTTYLEEEPRKQYLDTRTKDTYTITLEEGDYFTSIHFRADRLRLLGHDVTDAKFKEMEFDIVYFITDFKFNATRHSDVQKITTPNTIVIPAQIIADGLDDTWAPKTRTIVDVNNAKRLSANYDESGADRYNYISLTYTATLTPTTIVDINEPEKIIANVVPTATSTNGLLSSSGQMTINLPSSSGMRSDTHSDTVYYPEGTKAYLQLNTKVFKYIGKNERIEVEVIDGKTFLVYDLSGIQNHVNSFTIDNDDFWVTNNVESRIQTTIFLDSYFDIGPLLDTSNTLRPYYNYVPSATLQGYLYENPLNLESVAGPSDTVNRFVQMNVSTPTTIDIAASANIFLYPGIEDEVQQVESVDYNIHHAKSLMLGVDVGSTDTNYKNYHMVIELPRAGVSYKNASMTNAVISDESIYVRELSQNAVSLTGDLTKLTDENTPTIQFASTVSFDLTSSTSELTDLTLATNIQDARYVVVSFPEIPKNTFGSVEVALTGDFFDETEVDGIENHTLYDAANGATSYANVQARFEYNEEGGTEGVYLLGSGYSVSPAKYIFKHVVLSGKVFEEDIINYPDGILNNGDTQYHHTNIIIKNLNQLDVEGSPVQMEVIAGPDGTGYQIILPPIKTEDGDPAPYNLYLDLDAMGKTGTHTLTKNASDSLNVENNNNAPRFAPGDTPVGIPIYTDEYGYTSIRSAIPTVPLVTDFELENGYVDFGVYKNPTVTITPARVTMPEGLTSTVNVTISGVGTIVGDGYTPVDGGEYVDVTSELSGDKKTATVTLTGKKPTLAVDDTNIYLEANTKILNYFGEEIEGPTSEYLVYEGISVTFHPFDKDDNTIIGTWNDGTTDPSKRVLLNPIDGEFDRGTISNVNVPLITAPMDLENNHVFEGWQLEDGTKIYFDASQQELPADANLYPIFSIDEITDPNNDLNGPLPGDGIADVFQTYVIHEVTNGTWNDEVDTPDTTTQVVTFIKDRQPSIEGVGYYTVPESTPTHGYTNGRWDGTTSTGEIRYNPEVVTYRYEYAPIVPTVSITVEGNLPENDIKEVYKNEDVTLIAIGVSEGASITDLTYQWQELGPDNVWRDILGETNVTFDPPTDTLGTKNYKVVVTDTRNDATATSPDQADITVLPYTITFVPDGGTFTDMTTDNKTDVTTNEDIVTNTVDQPTKDSAVFAGWIIEGVDGTFTSTEIQEYPFDSDKTVTAQWAQDVLVDTDSDLNGELPGDGIADVYQTIVHHKIINGTWTGDQITTSEVVTFRNDDGNVSTNLMTATAQYTVPDSSANSGYHEGQWNGDESLGSIRYTTNEVTFEYEYIPIIPEVTQAVTDPGNIHPDTDAATVKKDTVITLTATGSSKGATADDLTYQWYEKDALGNLVEIPDATDIVYTPSTNEPGDKQYVVIVTDTRNNQTSTSEFSTITVVIEHDVIFEENGGSEVTDQKLYPEDVILEPNIPNKDGYIFVGWYLDPELTQKFDFSTPMPNENLTLYAKYEAIPPVPETGDNTKVLLWASILVISSLGYIVFRKVSKSKNE